MKFYKNELTALFIVVVSLLLMMSCAGTEPTALDRQNIVMSAYLYSGEPVTDIRVVNITPAGVQDTTIIVYDSLTESLDTVRTMPVDPINNAQVTIYVDDKAFPLQNIDDNGYYGDVSNSLLIESGKTYRLEALYQGKVATASTIVPIATQNLTISRDTIFLAPRGGRRGRQEDTSSQTTVVQIDSTTLFADLSWSNPENAPFYIMIERVVNVNDTGNGNQQRMGGQNRNRGYFTRDNTLKISTERGGRNRRTNNVSALRLNGDGLYEIKIYRVNDDYRILDQFIQQQAQAERSDMGYFEEPPSNVQGGLGIFTAFTSKSITITIANTQN